MLRSLPPSGRSLLLLVVILLVQTCPLTGRVWGQAAPAKIPSADLAAFSQQVAQKRRDSQLDAARLTEIDSRLQSASTHFNAGNTSEARRELARAQVELAGQEWNATAEFLNSLAVRPDRTISDSSLPVTVQLAQFYAARPPADWTRLVVRVRMIPATPLPNIQPIAGVTEPTPANAGAAERELGPQTVLTGDWLVRPALFQASAAGLPDGPWRVVADISLPGSAEPVCQLESPISQFVSGIESRRQDVETRLAKISGHEATAATIRYPFDVARVVNAGLRNWDSFDFPAPYDFAAGLRRSEELLKELEAGRDPLLLAKGDVKRHYWNESAKEILPWRMQVPTSWDGKSPLPLVLVLHGNTKDQDYYLDRDGAVLRKLAEEHGYLVVTPFGYHPNGGWQPATGGGGGRGGRGGARGRGAGGGDAGFAGFRGAADNRRGGFGALSEQDAVSVMEIVTKEYPVDASRMYLFGHSSGGAGSYYFAQKFAEQWAAVAISSGNVNSLNYPFDRIKGLPFMIVHGSLDNEVRPEQSRNFSMALKERNMDHTFIEFPEATHASIVPTALPKVFEFFKAHRRGG